MDQFSRRMVGFGVNRGDLSGPVICRMLNKVILKNGIPKYLSTDNDDLYTFYEWLRKSAGILCFKSFLSLRFFG